MVARSLDAVDAVGLSTLNWLAAYRAQVNQLNFPSTRVLEDTPQCQDTSLKPYITLLENTCLIENCLEDLSPAGENTRNAAMHVASAAERSCGLAKCVSSRHGQRHMGIAMSIDTPSFQQRHGELPNFRSPVGRSVGSVGRHNDFDNCVAGISDPSCVGFTLNTAST